MAGHADAAGGTMIWRKSRNFPIRKVRPVQNVPGAEAPSANLTRELDALRAGHRAGPEGEPRHSAGAALSLATVFISLVSLVGGVAAVQAREMRRDHERHERFMRVAEEGAINFTTVGWTSIDADVQRIRDNATGDYAKDFAKGSSAAFVDVVRRTKSTTRGVINESGIDNETQTDARVLVAVTVKTTNDVDRDETTRNWRLRVSVREDNGSVKVSKMEVIS